MPVILSYYQDTAHIGETVSLSYSPGYNGRFREIIRLEYALAKNASYLEVTRIHLFMQSTP